MILSDRLPRPSAPASRRAFAWSAGLELNWALVMIALWAVMPGVRRLVDWKSGFASISVISILPLAALVPAIFPLLYSKRLATLDRRIVMLAWIWIGGFMYAAAISLAQHNAFAAIYALGNFLLPLGYGLWVATIDLTPLELYTRVARFMLWLATPLALYGAFQFTDPPPWDVAWMDMAKITSIGVPLPFELRPFSTLNSPGIFADFLVATIILNLPRLRGRGHFWLFAQIALLIAVLLVTMVRSDWIAFVLGLVVYIALTPQRVRNLAVLGCVAMLCAVLAFNISSILGSAQAGTDLSKRLDTFTNLGSDVSYNERTRYWGEPLAEAIQNPQGQGLGLLGVAAKLGDGGGTVDFDNGYVARFTEMGYFGFGCYLAVIAGAFAFAVRRWRMDTRRGETSLATIAAAAIATQVALMFLDVSSDHHFQLMGMMFWLSLAIVDARARTAPAADSA